MILIIDNYDSFTYNLVRLISTFRTDVDVVRNDCTTVAEIRKMDPEGVVISPGPGRPENAGICVQMIRELEDIPVLGVCLGHQAIGFAFGGAIDHAPRLMHGKTSKIFHDQDPLFAGIKNPFDATRYHSLVLSHPVPEDLLVTARTDDGVVMGIRHRTRPVQGIQFHPESILTRCGAAIVENWLRTTESKP